MRRLPVAITAFVALLASAAASPLTTSRVQTSEALNASKDSVRASIAPADRKTMTVRLAAGGGQRTLHINDLPRRVRDLPFDLGSESFLDAVPSPDGRAISFTINGTADWIGVLSLANNHVSVAGAFAGGSAVKLHGWSPDSRYFAAEILPASGLRAVYVIDSYSATIYDLAYSERPETHDPERTISDVQWHASSTKLSIRTGAAQKRTQVFEYSITRRETTLVQ